MDQEEAFLQGIRDAPEDAPLLLVYADWLEEGGMLGVNSCVCSISERSPTIISPNCSQCWILCGCAG